MWAFNVTALKGHSMRMILALALASTFSLALAPQIAFSAGGGEPDLGDDDDDKSGGGNSGGGDAGGGDDGGDDAGGDDAGGSDAGGNDDSGSDDDAPKATKTSSDCGKGEVWDKKTKDCLKSEGAGLTDDQRYGAVRELAYLGRSEEAMYILGTMTEGETARVMTYQGFLLRQMGRVEEGIVAYERAIAMDPANILARSYYGQLLVLMNETDLAKQQLAAIYKHGGHGTWAERSLSSAIATGVTYNF
jgi:tetratricopeptide (TPR) repeat protein